MLSGLQKNCQILLVPWTQRALGALKFMRLRDSLCHELGEDLVRSCRSDLVRPCAYPAETRCGGSAGREP